MASPTTLQTGLQFLTKDFLRFWMADTFAGRVEAKHKANAPYWRGRKLRLGLRRGKGAPPGESAPVKLLAA